MWWRGAIRHPWLPDATDLSAAEPTSADTPWVTESDCRGMAGQTCIELSARGSGVGSRAVYTDDECGAVRCASRLEQQTWHVPNTAVAGKTGSGATLD